MNSTTSGAGDNAMMSLNHRISANGTDPAGLLIASATFLIVLGAAFEAVEAVWAHLLPNGFWLFSVILPGLWNMLAISWNTPIWHEFLKIAPLAMVATGMIMLFVRKSAYAREHSVKTRHGGDHDE